MKTAFRNILVAIPLTLGLLATPLAHANDALVGGLIGAGAGVLIGQHVGGRDGAIIGGALGAATGALIANDSPYYRSPPPRRAYAYSHGPRVFVAPPPQPVYYVPAGRGWRGPDYRPHHNYHRHERYNGPSYNQYDGRRGGRR